MSTSMTTLDVCDTAVDFSHHVVDATQCVIGVVERVGQPVHPVVGLTVTIEAHSHSRTGWGRNSGLMSKGNNSFSVVLFTTAKRGTPML